MIRTPATVRFSIRSDELEEQQPAKLKAGLPDDPADPVPIVHRSSTS
ncbi:MAG: hypothetical protein ACLS3C_11865 [Oscillospiraceae bacterium]